MYSLSPVTYNCPAWISGRERMTVENISWSNLHERILPTRQGSNPQSPDHQSETHPTRPPRPAFDERSVQYKWNILERALKPKSKIKKNKKKKTCYGNWLDAPQWSSSKEYTHKICFCREIRKISILFGWKIKALTALMGRLTLRVG